MHLNSIAGFLPFFEPAVDWDDHEADPYRRPSFTSPHQRQLHIICLYLFLLLCQFPHSPHMGVFQLIWSSIRNLTYDPFLFVEAHIPLKKAALPVPLLAWNPPSPILQPILLIVNSHIPSHDTELGRPKSKESRTEDARPKKKQRTMGISAPSTPATTTPALPVIRDIPPSATPANPSAPVVNLPRAPPAEERPVFAKAGVTSTPVGNPVIPPRSTVNHHLRPWTDAEDHELVTFKSDTRARPAWKTIGLHLKRDPEPCKLRWQILKQNMPELNSRTEPEAEAED